MAYCDQCGREIRDGENFCIECGAVTGGVAPAPTSAEAPPAVVRPARPKSGVVPFSAAVIFILVCGLLFWRHIPGLNQQDEAAAKANVPEGFAYIPPGKFMMGCSPGDDVCVDEEKPAHRVRITKGFYMKTTEVTQGEYKSVMGENPSEFTNCGDECPVEKVTWENARDYCKKIGGRLPTEAEWEYAARAGSTTRYYWGDSVDGDYAWYRDNSDSTTHPVKQKKPNAWGLYDMSGNVREWVNDWAGENYYASSPSANPKGPATGKYRNLRGGAWFDFTWYIGASSRTYDNPTSTYHELGFRCAQD